MRYTDIIDTHAHMDDPFFMQDIESAMAAQLEGGVSSIITSGSELPSSKRSVELAARFPFVYASVGVYPNETANLPEDYIESLRKLAAAPKVVAIGEIGLDYAFDPNYDSRVQERCFREQLALAGELSLPVVIHDRDADADTLRILKETRPKGVIHRVFSELKYARGFMDLGIHMGIGPQITYPNGGRLRDLVKEMPLELLVLETDAPFLPPFQLEGQSAAPAMISYVAEAIAEARGDCTPQQIIDIASANSRKLFGLK